jgi:hypothetical protein
VLTNRPPSFSGLAKVNVHLTHVTLNCRLGSTALSGSFTLGHMACRADVAREGRIKAHSYGMYGSQWTEDSLMAPTDCTEVWELQPVGL